MNTIQELIKHQIPVSVVTAVGKYNIADLKRIELDILHYGVGGWQIQLTIPEGRMDPLIVLNQRQLPTTNVVGL
ncbi:MAG: hypothetical protein BAJALOKI1v1_2370001 [Promethearchaeota archaeon]|nr:MAG: hypothetical protein BAJALOKI1v1_2370001 [Candidatus Lokiarchaeota archaeon]